jgi:hypothetical protein
MKVPRELRPAFRAATAAGWSVTVTGSNHLKWKPPAGQFVITGCTPCPGTRTAKNAVANLRKAGLAI